jgi:hypothetical protein
VPPPGWPEPPPGWIPPLGWQPDPSWPPVPPGHVFLHRVPRNRWVTLLLVLAVLLPLGGCGAFLVVAANDPTGCWFDPPPGDMGSITLVNDTGQAVSVFDCDEATCALGLDDAQAYATDQIAGYQYEMCDGFSVGVRDAGGRLLGCLVLPVGEPPPVSRLWLSQANACPVSVAAGTHPHLYTPG